MKDKVKKDTKKKQTNTETKTRKSIKPKVKKEKTVVKAKIEEIKKNLSDNKTTIDKKDKIILGILIVFYLIISFYNLGTLNAPKTFYHFKTVGDEVGIHLSTVAQNISKVRYFNGSETGSFSVIASTDGVTYKEIATLEAKSSFAWEDLVLNENIKYLKLVSKSANSYIGEMQLYNKYGEKVYATASDDQSLVVVDELGSVPAQISYLNSSYFDEIYFARSAYEYVNGIDAMEWVHPPLGKLIMAIPILLFGMSTFTYRLMGTIAGVLMIPVLYILAKKMFKSRKWAILAGLLMTFDTFHFAQTRMGTVDSFLVLFIMLSALFMYQYIDLDKDAKFKTRLKNLLLSGLFIGCAIATKWTGLYAGLALAIIFFGDLIYKNVIKKEKDKDLVKIILFCCLFFVVIPVLIYVFSYLLFPNVVNYHNNSIAGIIQQIKDMYGYHSNLTEGHPFSSAWYTWPILYKPVWYYVGYYGGNIVSTIVGIGNPVIWWFGVVASIFTLIASILWKKKESLFILIFILCTWLTYAFIGRAMFMYHFFPTLPFVMLAIVMFIKWITEKVKNNVFYVLYIALVVIMFIVFYPVVSGMLTTSDYVNALKWLQSWIF